MIKKFLLLSLVASQLMISCSSDDSPETDPVVIDPVVPEQTLAEQIANIIKQPYSKLTPTEQKVKLEAEANEMLVQLDKTKKLSAIETIENLNRLLDVSPVDIFNGKNDNEVEDIINVAGVYGIYTWDNTGKVWVKTASTSELKFVFPAKETQTTNNATFSSKSVSSDIKVKIEDTYDWQSGVKTNDYVFLPTSADATLTIDNTAVASFTQTAKYSNGKEVPNEFAYKMTLSDGYTWEMSGVKATENTSKGALTYNGKTLLSFNSGSNASIDALMTNDELVQYRGKANGLVQLLDNFLIIADMDLAMAAADEIALEKTMVYSDYGTKNHYADENSNNLKYSQGTVASFNKNSKLILVSKKDGTKIADIVQHSEKADTYTYNIKWVTDATASNGGYWAYDDNSTVTVNYYNEVYYLKFGDNTEVEMGAYFSTGFSSFEAKFEEFIKAFEN
ncbi:hypothetical protein [Flavobacterium pectinovorum]|uniref:DUF4988 domain-containing protein n=1 Tax=Flavobacterium pectinovorum TaxID=29533 RepID=A0AB36P2Z6_9FLAO|nr:hypothetical protein [Flavobacterium pectinovorum]OXB06066.1 hypothetical protein B0A72_08675 [Flavobacterium pectinovorum]SHM94005.1 hypothetical protein SAMN05444387_3506 [Flavobacterium pectinovorum]